MDMGIEEAAAARVVHPGIGFREFVAGVALIQATIALAIDMMVPALGQIGAQMQLGVSNERQWVITAFLLGFGIAQLGYGVAADRFGRKPVLVLSLSVYIAFSLACAAAPSFGWLLAARAAEGVGAAGAQVLTVAIIRDCYAGRRMAEVNSLTFMVFLSAPIFAPSLGQLVLFVAPWPVIFIGLGAYGALILGWVLWRLPETQTAAGRRPADIAQIRAAFAVTLRCRLAIGYTLAATCILGGWLGFINSAQQVFAGVFRVPTLFPLIFAACSVCMAIAALTNARLVERVGMRPLSHGALAGYIIITLAQAGLALTDHSGLIRFALLQSAMMFCFGLTGANFNAIAMEPLGEVAGTAASLLGFIDMLGATLIGFFIGQRFDGTLVPMVLGFLVCGLLAMAVIVLAERGRLFRARAR
jgi:DHA1 family bicyclomycin/chloramphenicol resistance-like MFS transporter